MELCLSPCPSPLTPLLPPGLEAPGAAGLTLAGLGSGL